MEENKYRKYVKVARAVIEKDGYILAAQRSKNVSLPLKWEFPGGKIREGETPDDCVKREVREELDIDVEVKYMLPGHIHTFCDVVFEFIPLICSVTAGYVKCMEHNQILWEKPQNLIDLDWAQGDKCIFKEYLGYLKSRHL